MMVFHRQIKGIIAVAIFLAIIPFFRFVYDTSPDPQGPVFSKSSDHTIAVELVATHGKSGIYFVEPSMTLKHLVCDINSDKIISENLRLENGMSIKLDPENKPGIVLEKISAEKRMALGLPLDVNLASCEELMLIPGVGEATAEKIISRRHDVGQFRNLNQLMEINGIKEKKLLKLSQYLFVEENNLR